MFQLFSSSGNDDWKRQAVKDLKSTPFEDIIWEKTFGKILPYYTEIPKNSGFVLSEKNTFCIMPLTIVSEGEEQKANLFALEALNSGADSVLFDLTDSISVNFNILLKDIALQHCSVAFLAGSTENYEEFEQYVLMNYAEEADNIKGFFEKRFDFESKNLLKNFHDFSSCVFRCDTKDEKLAVSECIRFFAEILSKAPDFASKIVFSLSIYDDFFVEIAKIRALKKLLLAMSQKEKIASAPRIHIRTSPKNSEKERADPYLNMISNTTQAMSAVIAGVDFLTVLPHDYRMAESSSFSARIARNVVNILCEESFLAQAADASAGAYYAEVLTEKIAQEAYQSAF
jgi:methylmalonyl-CoA mutase